MPNNAPWTTEKKILLPVVFTAVGPLAAALFYVYAPAGINQLVYFLSKALLNAFPIVWWYYRERTVTPSAAAPERPRWLLRRDLPTGLASGLLLSACVVGAYWLFFQGRIDTGMLQENVKQFGAYENFVFFALFLALINSGLEEYYWRWFVFGRMRRLVPLGAALALSGIAFAAHHFVVLQRFLNNPAMALVLSLGIAVGGVVWALQYHLGGRLWGVWLSHLLVDVAVLSIGHTLLF